MGDVRARRLAKIAFVAGAATLGLADDEGRFVVDDWGCHDGFGDGQQGGDEDVVEKHLGGYRVLLGIF